MSNLELLTTKIQKIDRSFENLKKVLVGNRKETERDKTLKNIIGNYLFKNNVCFHQADAFFSIKKTDRFYKDYSTKITSWFRNVAPLLEGEQKNRVVICTAKKEPVTYPHDELLVQIKTNHLDPASYLNC